MDNIKKILSSELHSSLRYLERIFHSIIELSHLTHHQHFQEMCQKLNSDLSQLLEQYFFHQPINIYQKKPVEIRQNIQAMGEMLEVSLKLDIDHTQLLVEFINCIYRHAHPLHQFCLNYNNLDIQFPRINLLEMKSEGNLPLFYLPWEAIVELQDSKASLIDSLSWQRDKQYNAFVQQGHQAIFEDQNDLALEKFKRAALLKETAEIMTLIGWSYSLLNNLELAKKYCLKAIELDPDYGPPYNDMGSYLIKEGQLNESLKWFSLAKAAPKYHNREYPYINAGRAYIGQKKFKKALSEFKTALVLAPYHQELVSTIEQLQNSMEHQESIS